MRAQDHPEYKQELDYLHYTLRCLDQKDLKLDRMLDAGATDAARGGLREVRDNLRKSLKMSKREAYFGRIDNEDGHYLYIGRMPVVDDDRMVVASWATKMAQKWYLSSPSEPQGVIRKRHLRVSGASVQSIRDEALVLQAPPEETRGVTLDRILQDLGQDRSGRMVDMVATIQGDQYSLISQQLEGLLVVQGGPGTGKTAVALHRAAWLRYRHKGTLKPAILILGPNDVFMDYISDILPSIGDQETRQRAISRLAPDQPEATREDPPGRQRIKGDSRMATVIRNAIRHRIRPPVGDVSIQVEGLGIGSLIVQAIIVQEVLASALRRSSSYSEARTEFWEDLPQRLYAANRISASVGLDSFVDTLNRNEGWKSFVRRAWRRLDAREIVEELFHRKSALSLAAAGVLTEEECNEILEQKSTGPRQWSIDDLFLLDEAKSQLTGVDEQFDHVIVDESQDLSPMQLRAIARRARDHSITLAGDMGQATGVWEYESWDDLVRHLEAPRVHLSELTLSYRVPAQIMELAGRLLPEINSRIQLPRSVRTGRASPVQIPCNESELASCVARFVGGLSDRFAGTVGVISEAGDLPGLAESLTANGVPEGRFRIDRLKQDDEQRITLTSPTRAKGVEFDMVVVVEPRHISDSGPTGLRQLFVALTRATQHLVLIHSKGLPPGLEPVASMRADQDPWDCFEFEASSSGLAELPSSSLLETQALVSKPYEIDELLAQDDSSVNSARARESLEKSFLKWLGHQSNPVVLVYATTCLERLLKASQGWEGSGITLPALKDLAKNPGLRPVIERIAGQCFPGASLDAEGPASS